MRRIKESIMRIDDFMTMVNGQSGIVMNIDNYNINLRLIDEFYSLTFEDEAFVKTRAQHWREKYFSHGIEPFFKITDANETELAGMIMYGAIE